MPELESLVYWFWGVCMALIIARYPSAKQYMLQLSFVMVFFGFIVSETIASLGFTILIIGGITTLLKRI